MFSSPAVGFYCPHSLNLGSPARMLPLRWFVVASENLGERFMILRIQLCLALCLCVSSIAQGTFSIVAVDPVTGEVGSAGGSCIPGSIILSDVFPGAGVIHTQAFYLPGNQANARTRFLAGDSPQEIIDWLIANDLQGNPTIRQYGIVDIGPDAVPRSAGHTGVNTNDFKGHLLGPNYAIQGNILLGPEILEDMETMFLNTEGTLAHRMMAAMQGANVIGADTRCRPPRNSSSISAFVRVAHPTDQRPNFLLDLNINNSPQNVEPIDLLQQQFDNFFATRDPDFDGDGNLGCDDIDGLVATIAAGTNVTLYDLSGDGFVDQSDLEEWLAAAGAVNNASGNPYLRGDANLDGTVDAQDFITWNANKFSQQSAWCQGNFNADGAIDAADFIEWNQNKFTTADQAVVPEPATAAIMWAMFAILGAWVRSSQGF